MTVKKTGFLYIYDSNESGDDVLFDNLVVTHYSGPVIEETHYYPFGLTMAGISNHALKGLNYPENRKKYNGIEFTDELDLNWYDAQLRNLDPQIGRWNQIDPKIENMEMWSPYVSNYDNPIRYNDFLGDEPGDPPGFVAGFKAGFTGYFGGIVNAVSHPIETLKQSVTPQSLALNAMDVGGGIRSALNVAENVRTIVTEGANGAGKVAGNIAAQATVAIATEGIGKAIGALKGAKAPEVVNPFSEGMASKPKGDLGESLTNGHLQSKFPNADILQQVTFNMEDGTRMRADHVVAENGKVTHVAESKVDGGKLSPGQTSFFQNGVKGKMTGRNAGDFKGVTVDPNVTSTGIYKWSSATGTFTVH
jgi:RHS repeat-associated protein